MDEHPNRHAGDPVRRKAVRRKYLAWNAASAAGAEIIEYLEELVDLAKLVVGANEFRSGLLMRATYQDYVQGLTDGAAKSEASGAAVDLGNEARDTLTRTPIQSPGVNRRRRLTTIRSSGSTEDPVPASLQRIQSRKVKAGTGRQATN